MSKFRTIKDRNKALGVRPLQRGPNGRFLCRYCNEEVPKNRRTFCSKECVHEYKVRSDWRYARRCAVKAAGGAICAHCGLNCSELQKRLRKLPPDERKKLAEEYGIPKSRILKSIWDADHIIPVHLGGGESGLDNIQILCWACHQIKSLEEAQKRSKIRKKSKAKRVRKIVQKLTSK